MVPRVDLGLGGRRALVTGGTHGIGRAVVECLASEGCRVALCARDGDEARAVAAALPNAHGTGVDVERRGAVSEWVEDRAHALGGVDLLVANVGGRTGAGDFVSSTRDDWVQTFDLNVGHTVEALRACIAHMPPGASAVLISSISGSRPQPGAQYGAAKAALDYAAASLARELGPRQIRVNAVAPGSVIFPGGGWGQLREGDPDRFAAFERDEFPFGRLGTPSEIGRVVAFVLSDAASWINGTTITADGGQNAPSAGGY